MKTSKASLARLLIDRGCTLSFNTLRGYKIEKLQAMLMAQRVADHVPAMPEPVAAPVVEPVYIPTDAELMQAAQPVPVAVLASEVPVATRCGTWAGMVVLASIPFVYALNFFLG